MPTSINAPITVLASFQAGQLSPQLMEYNHRRVRFNGVSLRYAEGEGEQRVWYCVVYTDAAVYTLAFWPHRLVWRLLTISDEAVYENG